jgi:hypothetical protein
MLLVADGTLTMPAAAAAVDYQRSSRIRIQGKNELRVK